MKLEGKKVFLSGPMTGKPHYNVAQFATAHAIVAKDMGAKHVFDPAYMWLTEREDVSKGKTHEDYMLDCVNQLTRRDYTGKPYYDVLVSLPEWHLSEGAMHERDVAEHCGIACVDLEELIVEEEL